MHRSFAVPLSLAFIVGLMLGLIGREPVAAPAQANPQIQPPSVGAAAPVLPPIPGVYAANVLRVIDGDTLEARVNVWIGQDIITKVRLRGIDAPEIKGACGSEQARAVAARDALSALVDKRHVILTHVSPDKYFGRVVARVVNDEGLDAGSTLLSEGHAQVYSGRRRENWCTLPSAGQSTLR